MEEMPLKELDETELERLVHGEKPRRLNCDEVMQI